MTLNEFLYEVQEQMDIAASNGNATLLNSLCELADCIKKQLGIETPNCCSNESNEADLFFEA